MSALSSVRAQLVTLRLVRDETQRDVAPRLKTSQGGLANLERGWSRTDMLLSTIERWAAALDATVEIRIVPNTEEKP